MNALVNQIMGQQIQNSPIMEAYKTIQSALNTDTALRQQLAKMPNGKQVLENLDQCGGNYEQAAMISMKNMGIDMNDLAKIANSIGL